jgi:hypothetical protein
MIIHINKSHSEVLLSSIQKEGMIRTRFLPYLYSRAILEIKADDKLYEKLIIVLYL